MTTFTTTVREQILTTIATLLQPVSNAVVYRSREAALAIEEGVAILIRPSEEIIDNVSQPTVFRTFRIEISVIARGTIPDQMADPALLAMQTALLADQTLGGLVARIFEEETKWDFEVADQNAVAAVVRYRILYATPAGSLTSTS